MRTNLSNQRRRENKFNRLQKKLAKSQILEAKKQILKSPENCSKIISELADSLGIDPYQALQKVLTEATYKQEMKIRSLFGINIL